MNPQRAIQTRKSVLGSNILTLVVLVVFVGAAYGLDLLKKPAFSPNG